MNEQGIRFWAITTGNEPLNGVIGWVFVHFMSLGWTPHNQVRLRRRALQYYIIQYIWLLL